MKDGNISILLFVILGIVTGVVISILLANRSGLWSLTWLAAPAAFAAALLLLTGNEEDGSNDRCRTCVRMLKLRGK